MTVYIEYVIINNLIIDYILLKASFVFTGLSLKRFRLFLCAFLGACIALVFPLIKLSNMLLFCLKVMSGLLILLLANNYKTLNQFIKCTAIFFMLTFLLGGAVLGTYNLLGLSLGSENAVILVLLPAYLIYKLAKTTFVYLYKRVNLMKFCYDTKLYYKDKVISAKGFLDTGNNLYDKESAVILCSSEFVKEFLGERILTVKFSKINISTVVGEKQKLCFRLDKFVLYIENKEHIFNYITLCIADIKSQDYQIILHPALLKERKDSELNNVFEKVS